MDAKASVSNLVLACAFGAWVAAQVALLLAGVLAQRREHLTED